MKTTPEIATGPKSGLMKPKTVALAIAGAFVGVVFLITLSWRLKLAFMLPGARTEVVTAQVYTWLVNWIYEGPASIHFMMPYLPLSIESPDLQYRSELYRSYPPGALVPVYLLSILGRGAPSISVLSTYDLICHAVLVAAIFGAVFVVTAGVARAVTRSDAASFWSSALLASSSAIFMTIASGPAYFFARVYVWDVAVLPWFGLALLMDALYAVNRNSRKTASIALALQMIVFTAGLWTDWLMVIVIFVWIAMRIVEHLLLERSAISAWRAIGLAILTFVINLALIFAWRILAGLEQAGDLGVLGELQRTVYKFFYRAGLTNEDAVSSQDFFLQLKFNLLSYFSISLRQLEILMAASLLCVLLALALSKLVRLRDAVWPLASLAPLAALPPVAYLCLLPQHAYYHDFTILKFAIPIAVLVLALAPAAVAAVVATVADLHFQLPARGREVIFSIVACGTAISGIYFSMTRYDTAQQHFPPIRGEIGALGTVIGRNVEYADVVFSPQFEIAYMTEESGFSRKIVRRSTDVDKDLPTVTSYVCAPFNLVVVSDGTDMPKRATPPSEIARDSGLVFYRWRNLQPTACAINKGPK
jgi:hypothetical protein